MHVDFSTERPLPLPDHKMALPPFPLDALPDVIRDFSIAESERSWTPPEMAAHSCLGVIATAVQNKFIVCTRTGYKEQLSFYSVTVAAPGERKSAVLSSATAVLYDFETDANKSTEATRKERHMERMLLQSQIDNLNKKSTLSCSDSDARHTLLEKLDQLPELHELRLTADDCTPEALVSLMHTQHGSISVVSAEGGIFDILAGRFSRKPNIDVYLKAHCGDPIRVDRKGREPETIPSPALTTILAIQPDLLTEVMTSTVLNGRGLLSRFVFCFPNSKIGSRKFAGLPMPEIIRSNYESRICTLLTIPVPEARYRLTLDPSAETLLSNFFEENEEYLLGEGLPHLHWASKLPGLTMRLAGLMHLVTNAETATTALTIDGATMAGAIQLGKYYRAHAAYAFDLTYGNDAVNKAKFVLAKATMLGQASLKKSILFRACRGRYFKTIDDILPTLQLLEEYKYLYMTRPDYSGTGRPPDHVITFHPSIFTTTQHTD